MASKQAAILVIMFCSGMRCKIGFPPTVFIITIFYFGLASTNFAKPKTRLIPANSARICPEFQPKRARIGPSMVTVSSGHSFLSVTNAVSSAECSGQFGSRGMSGIALPRIVFAVSAFASK